MTSKTCGKCGALITQAGPCPTCDDAPFGRVRREDASLLFETIRLLQADREALWSVVKESCELLGVTEDSEDDWPKLPIYIQALQGRIKDDHR